MVASATDIEENHPVHDSFALILEEDRLSVTTVGTIQVVGSTQSGILHQVVHNSWLFLGDRHEIVTIDERFSRFLLIVAITTGVQQNMVGSIDFWI